MGWISDMFITIISRNHGLNPWPCINPLFNASVEDSPLQKDTMQIRLLFTALVSPILLPIDHANILYIDTVENPRERSNKNNKTMKTLQYRERDKKFICWGKKLERCQQKDKNWKKMWRRTSYTFIFSEFISKEKVYGSNYGSLHHVLPWVYANLNLKHVLCKMRCLHPNLLH